MQPRFLTLWLLGTIMTVSFQIRAESVTESEGVPQDPGARDRAKVLFDQGISYYRSSHYVEALWSFRAAQDTFDSPVFVFNIARSCEQLKDVSCALRHYRDYQRRMPKADDVAKVNKRILALEAELSSRGIQQVTVRTAPSGAALRIDGEARGKTPWTGEIVLGVHAIQLAMQGYTAMNVDINVPGAHASDYSFLLSRATSFPAAAQPVAGPNPLALSGAQTTGVSPMTIEGQKKEATRRRSLRAWTYVALGTGVAALGGALVFETLSRQSEADVRELPVQRDRVAAYETMGDRQTTARVLAGVGLGLTALGATLLVFDLRAPSASQGAVTARVEARGSNLTLAGAW
jgi:hypothetical protein